jgi:hypothetical protein
MILPKLPGDPISFEQRHHFVDLHSFLTHQQGDQGVIYISRPGSHHQSIERGKSHRIVDRFTRLHSCHRAAAGRRIKR